ncbi:hypothetical protein LZ318_30865 [Saccharopolyspora indica]|uniref:hypothetical protein n=1 Tax=Saccharopolyspora indica TaxID=1229659 RepID=UPI0022EA98CC|nr:hypothetical protein [Saccharopolyspora indica]MDA3644365.1 hypothetical protein [Saccharopolyspora indica]
MDTSDRGPLTVAELYQRVLSLRDHAQERPEMSPRERAEISGAHTMAAAITRLIERVDCTCAPEPPSAAPPHLRLLRDED